MLRILTARAARDYRNATLLLSVHQSSLLARPVLRAGFFHVRRTRFTAPQRLIFIHKPQCLEPSNRGIKRAQTGRPPPQDGSDQPGTGVTSARRWIANEATFFFSSLRLLMNKPRASRWCRVVHVHSLARTASRKHAAAPEGRPFLGRDIGQSSSFDSHYPPTPELLSAIRAPLWARPWPLRCRCQRHADDQERARISERALCRAGRSPGLAFRSGVRREYRAAINAAVTIRTCG